MRQTQVAQSHFNYTFPREA